MINILECFNCPLCNSCRSSLNKTYQNGDVHYTYISFTCGLSYFKYADGRESVTAAACPKVNEIVLKMLNTSMAALL